jgi:hypothetical protein
MQATWRVYLVSALIACVVAVGTTFVTVRLLVPPGAPSGTFQVLEGVAEVPWGAELDVFYKSPFAAPPNLTFPEGLDHSCHLDDQKVGSFRLRRNAAGFAGEPSVAKVKWKAEGRPAP